MRVFVSHDTALSYWRNHFGLDLEIGEPLAISPGEAYAYRDEDVLGCYPNLYKSPG